MVIYLDNMNLEKIFNFIKEKKGRDYPFIYKVLNNIPLSKDELNVKGDLDLYDKDISSLPDNLKIEGFLSLSRTNITSLPDNLEVGDNLFINYTDITSLPDNLIVGGSLYANNTKLTSLPDNLELGGNISLIKTPLSNKYTKEEIRKMIKDKGGWINGSVNI